MNKRSLFFVVTAVVLFAVYAANFTDWFKSKSIRISYRGTPSSGARNASVIPVTFMLNEEYKLTSIKVFTAEELRQRKYPRPIWHLVSITNPVPVTDFQYGGTVKGMRLADAKAGPEPLKPDETYKVVVEAGKKLRGEREFKSRGSSSTDDNSSRFR